MSRDSEILAVRSSVALSRQDGLSCVRLTGPGAFDAVDKLCAGEIFIREGQLMHTLLLRETAEILADVYLCALSEGYLLVADGVSNAELLAHLSAHAEGPGVVVEPLEQNHAVFGLDGPYAWELLAALAGPESVGLPFQALFEAPQFTCLRAGKTGEYGSLLVTPRASALAVYGELLAKGKALDVVEVGQEALDQCALENAFFNARREVRPSLTPIELQLQWRASRRKEFIGAQALQARRGTATSRTVWLRSAGPLASGDELRLGERPIGEILNAGFSPTLQEHVALGLVELAVAHPGVEGLHAGRGSASSTARTISAPVIDNRSLHIDPQRHSYAERAAVVFPPIA